MTTSRTTTKRSARRANALAAERLDVGEWAQGRELRLRRRIDELTDRNIVLTEKVADLERVRPARKVRRCVYCGHRCYGIACNIHADLVKVDPHYGSSA